MTSWLRSLIALAALLAAGACSLETAINAMSTEQDRQFAQDVVANLRSGNEQWLAAQWDESEWARRRGDVKRFSRLLADVPGPPRLVAYRLNSSIAAGSGTTRSQGFALVTEGPGRWVTTRMETVERSGGPRRIVRWDVAASAERPPELAMFETSEKAVPFLWGLGALALAGLVATVWGYVRYRRRKRETAAGR
ncbi:MAG TPA: hypothetical protein VF552_16565 [Allosphingosinicella sp.]|jgi:hypothetical protein